MDFNGTRSTVSSAIYNEYLKLSKTMKLVVLAKQFDNKTYDNIKIVRVPKTKKPLWTIRNIIAFSLSTIHSRNDFDIVYTRMLGLHNLIPAIISKLFFRKKFVMFISGAMQVIRTKENRFRRPVIKFALRLADTICTHSPAVIEDFEQHLGSKIETKKLHFLNHCVGTEIFKPVDNITKENIIISVGRVSREKGFELLIKAIPYVVKQISDIKIKIVGPLQDQNYYQELIDLSKKEGCEKYVEFVGGVPHNEMAELLVKSKIFVSTSKVVGVSYAIAEAMSCGIPVISTAKGSIPTMNNKITGFIINTEQELASKIIELLGNDKLRDEIAINSRLLIEEKFSESYFIEKLHKILSNLTNK